MEERLTERRTEGGFPFTRLTRGNDAKGPIPITGEGDGRGAITAQNMKQDKRKF